MGEVETHKCTRCEEVKPRSEFHKRASRPLGIQQPCKPCHLKDRRNWYARNTELALGINRRWRESNRGKVAAANRRRELKRVYGLTIEQYDAMLSAQGGVCAICGGTSQGKRLAVDHDHSCCPGKKNSCGKCVRGLLCDPCNRSLGWVDHHLSAVIAYLSLADLLTSQSQSR